MTFKGSDRVSAFAFFGVYNSGWSLIEIHLSEGSVVAKFLLSISAVASVHISTLFIVFHFEEMMSSTVESMLSCERVSLFVLSSFENGFLFLAILSFEHNDALVICTKIFLSIPSFNQCPSLVSHDDALDHLHRQLRSEVLRELGVLLLFGLLFDLRDQLVLVLLC